MRRPRGVSLRGRPSVGRHVVFDVADGAQVIVEDGAVIGDGCRFHVHAGTVRIGAGARLGDRCVLLVHAGAEVGAGARLGDDVVLVDFEHGRDDVETPVRHQPIRAQPISIGENAVVGHRAVLEPGATVLAGASVPEQTVRR